MDKREKHFITKYDCTLPLPLISLVLKDIQSLSGFERILHKKPITKLIEGYSAEYSKSEYELLCKALNDLEFNAEQIVETNYFIQIKYALLKDHPFVTKFEFKINLHFLTLNRTAIVCELIFEPLPNDEMKRIINNARMINMNNMKNKNSKVHQSTVLIGCSFGDIKKILYNYKLFNRLVPELCTRVETNSVDDIKEGDEIKLIYDIPEKPSIEVNLKATSVIDKEEECSITLKTEELGLSNTPSQQIEWIVKRISSYEIKAILRHSFDSVIQEEFIELLSRDKKIMLNRLKNVLENKKEEFKA